MSMRGFTLIELVIAMALMAVVSLFSVQFITKSASIYQQGKDREQLMSDVRFGIERLNREVRNAVPGSLRIEDIAGNEEAASGACVRFWPIKAAHRYQNIEVTSADTKVSVAAQNIEIDSDKDWMIISPLGLDAKTATCEASDCAVRIDKNPGKSDSLWTFTFADPLNFSRIPTQRLYIAQQQVRYCVIQEKLTRAEAPIQSDIIKADKVLMAEHLTKSEFTINTNGLYSRLGFNLTASNYNESIEFSHKIRLYNAP